MYWIEIEMSNGKTIRRESEDLNYTYAIHSKYTQDAKRKYKTGPYAVRITAGSEIAGHTGTWNL